MEVRDVSNRGGNIIGPFSSTKLGRMVSYESTIERDYLYVLDFDPMVLHFAAQPRRLEYIVDGKKRYYTPDFEVEKICQKLLVECKLASMVALPDNVRKFAVAREWCAANGYTFLVVTDTDLRTGWRLKNIKLLAQFKHKMVALDTRSRIFDILLHGPITLGALAAQLASGNPAPVIAALRVLSYYHTQSPRMFRFAMMANAPEDPQAVVATLLAMAYCHEIALDLDTGPIGTGTPVSVSGKEG